MSIRIQIVSTALETRNVQAKGSGRVWHFLEQTAWAYTTDRDGNPHPHPEKIVVTLPQGQTEAYPPGDYTLHPASFYVGNFSSLEMRARLLPVKARS